MNFSRRTFLQGAGAAGAAAITTGMPFGPRLAHAGRGGKKSAIVVVYTSGGFNSIFSSADSYLNKSFGVTAGNIFDAGNGLMVDKAFADGLGAYAKTHMAAVGVKHGTNDHGQAARGFFEPAGGSAIIRLAGAMGGDAPIKAASILGKPNGTHTAVGGVSVQAISDMGSTIAALQGGAVAEPARNLANRAAIQAELMSKERAARNPSALRSDAEGRQALMKTLGAARPNFNFAAIPAAYNVTGTGINGNNMNAPMAAAELMVRAGANVITVTTGFNWDSHGGADGSGDRNRMSSTITPGVQLFINRMMADPATAAEYDVTVVFGGDFARSTPNSDHGNVLSSLVIGPGIKVGTSGKMTANVDLAGGTPSWPGLWSMLSDLTAAPTNPFGPIPEMHKALLL
jgi:hypothetical protein